MSRDYSFPLNPYQVQTDFMDSLYDCMSRCRGGLFESPTGTGKSLSIICGSLTFLTDNCGKKLQELLFDPAANKRVKADLSGIPLYKMEEMIKVTNCEELSHRKIVYLSRTHSQLDQFVGELKRTKWGQSEKIRMVRLASRKMLCVNEEVNYNKQLVDMNCRELVRNAKVVLDGDINEENKSREPKCIFYQNQHMLKKILLTEICDIEDLVKKGQQIKSCPYYATRSAIAEADLVLAPYTSMLSQQIRKSIGLSLTDSYVIIDESHNIIKAISDQYSESITRKQLSASEYCLSAYLEMHGSKMLDRKRELISQAKKLAISLITYIDSLGAVRQRVEDRNQVIQSLGLNDIDFFALSDFFEEEQTAIKIYKIGNKPSQQAKIDLFSLKTFVNFVACLNETSGKLLVYFDTELKSYIIKFLLLDPFQKFEEILSEAKCVILAGGTMTPAKEFEKLFKSLPRDEFMRFSCGHVIPPENLLFTTMSESLSGQNFKFTFENRNNLKLYQDLGNTIADIAFVVPNGMVVFAPSYSFLSKLQELFSGPILEKISSRKRVFFDKKDEDTIREYTECANTSGAILFAVIRGTLSEGINFSDKLGRCVLLIGLPYLNIKDLEVEVKMRYYDSLPDYSGREYYENSCNIAINQSIGRAIRHIRDFAAIILIDSRHHISVSSRPGWILDSYKGEIPHQELIPTIRSFFRKKINL